MKRGRSTGKPTAAQQVRMDAIRDIGCIVAHSLGLGYVPCEVHHLTVGGKHGAKRRGHDFIVGLSPWSHRGEPFGGMSAETCERLFGPSYAKQPRRFRQEIGSDDYLLDLQNTLIEKHTKESCPWAAGTDEIDHLDQLKMITQPSLVTNRRCSVRTIVPISRRELLSDQRPLTAQPNELVTPTGELDTLAGDSGPTQKR